MSSQVYSRPESSAGAMEEAFDIATDPFMTAIYADPVTMHMGNLAYDYLTQGMQEDPVTQFTDWLGQSLVDNTRSVCDPLLGSVAEQSIPNFTMSSPSGFPGYFPLTPSPPPSQASTPERQQPTLPPHEPSCHQASSVSVRGKWSCTACGKTFRGNWECNRHIKNAGKRAKCLACNKKINGREDSLRRHYRKYCKRMDLGRDSGNLRFEDAFIHL